MSKLGHVRYALWGAIAVLLVGLFSPLQASAATLEHLRLPPGFSSRPMPQ